MVSSDLIKTFKIVDADSGEKFDIEMKIIDYIKYRQMNDLIRSIRRLKNG